MIEWFVSNPTIGLTSVIALGMSGLAGWLVWHDHQRRRKAEPVTRGQSRKQPGA